MAYGGPDCDDANPQVATYITEIVQDGVDQNCDGIDDIDEDGDGVYSLRTVMISTPRFIPCTDTCYDNIDSDC